MMIYVELIYVAEIQHIFKLNMARVEWPSLKLNCVKRSEHFYLLETYYMLTEKWDALFFHSVKGKCIRPLAIQVIFASLIVMDCLLTKAIAVRVVWILMEKEKLTVALCNIELHWKKSSSLNSIQASPIAISLASFVSHSRG